MTPTTIAAIVTLGNIFFTPVIVIVTMWIKGALESSKSREKREDGLIEGLQARVDNLERRLDEKEREIKEIRIELKNRDAEYVKLYQEHTTLKAKYEALLADHDELKRKYDVTAGELGVLKDDIKRRAETTAEAASKLTK